MATKVLRMTALFGGLSEDQLKEILNRCEERHYAAGDTVIREGEKGDEMFIVVQGKVEVKKAVRLDIPGRDEVNFEKQLVTLGEGDYFGEVALLAADTRSATIKALTDLEVWVLSNKSMQALMDEDRELGYELLTVMSKELCSRLTRANEDIRKLLTAFAIAINR